MTKPDIQTCKACRLGPPDWEYTCHNCRHDFIMPAARGPTEEKNRACPKCSSQRIERLNIIKSEACAPGG